MEKISALIDKLQELKNSDAGLQTISYYTQLLQAEILHQRNMQRQKELKGHGHVAVILPAHHTPAPVTEKAAPPPEKVMQNGYVQDRVPMKSRPQEQAATLFDPPPQRPVTDEVNNAYHQPAPQKPATDDAHQQKQVVDDVNSAYQPKPDANNAYHQPTQQKPDTTNAYHQPTPQKPATDDTAKPNHLHNGNPQHTRQPAPDASNGIRKELNELISKTSPSLNDALRSNGKVELGERLGGMGVKDLKDAIGINDKFQFIQELFRSDKTMYERSVKTINESTSLLEAENWMERELKIKLGWNEHDHLVKQFYSLVRKRFS